MADGAHGAGAEVGDGLVDRKKILRDFLVRDGFLDGFLTSRESAAAIGTTATATRTAIRRSSMSSRVKWLRAASPEVAVRSTVR
mgnify:CR=1 FL=1